MLFSSVAPCAPQALSMKPLCDTDSVLVSWAQTNLAQSYYLTATGLYGDVQNCSSTKENCTLSRLHCGQSYTLSVIASDGNCTSPASQALTFRTSETHTIISKLQCTQCPFNGQIAQNDRRQNRTGYSFSMYGTYTMLRGNTAWHFQILTSSYIMTIWLSCNLLPITFFSNPCVCATLSSAPCAPLSMNVSMSCGNSSATLSWPSSKGSVWYYASIVNAQGDNRQCNTTGTSCIIAGLQCGALYNFSVQASDAVCNSSRSPLVQKGTGK